MSDSDDELKRAERRGYSNGYNAGIRRKKSEISAEAHRRAQQALMDRIYIAMLSAAMNAQGWTIGDKAISTTEERVDLARAWTRVAMKGRQFA